MQQQTVDGLWVMTLVPHGDPVMVSATVHLSRESAAQHAARFAGRLRTVAVDMHSTYMSATVTLRSRHNTWDLTVEPVPLVLGGEK